LPGSVSTKPVAMSLVKFSVPASIFETGVNNPV
jgi:hypothetical protein